MKRNSLSDQMEWYSTQPVSYRRMWWEWARTQPNFAEMYQWATLHEKDDSVLCTIKIFRDVHEGNK